jgi:Domain of unknown function (DUF4330)
MALLDAKGRLFGKISLLDISMAFVLVSVVLGLLLIPGRGGQSIVQAQLNNQSIEIDALVMGLSTSNPDQILKAGDSTNVIIRNQPYGQVQLKDVKKLSKTVTASQPDGTVKAFPDPRPENKYSTNLVLTIVGKGQMTDAGPILGNIPVKVGIPIELEGKLYSFRASIVDVRAQR